MDCERCESLLIDYVSGELGDAETAELRAALEVCEHCRLTLAKLERGRALAAQLPTVEPPPAILAAVMRAAEARAAELAREHEAARPPERAPAPKRAIEEEGGPLEGVWRWLAGLLHGPQFAMAALLVLMVGVGLWWVPALTGPRAGPPPLVSDTPPATGPSASLAPREVPRLEIDPRTGRIVSSEEVNAAAEEREATGPARPIVVAEAEEAADRTTDRAPAPALLEADDERTAEADADRAALAAAGSVALGAGESLAGRAELGALPPLPAPSTSPATGMAPSAPYRGGEGSASGVTGERVARSSLDDLDSVPAPSPDETMLPASLHTQARLLARSGSLADAARTYERLLSEHDDYASAPRAMVELADVYRRSGSISSARRWLERAARFPSVASDARRELARLDAMAGAPALELAEPDVAGAAEAERATSAAPSGE